MSKTGAMERAELYQKRSTQLLLSKFISGEIEKLDPIYDPKKGYRYPLVESIVGTSEKAEEFLNKLYEAGILERKLYDKTIYCPFCGSSNVSTRYCCPFCGSFNIKKSALIEHVQCGYIDVEEKFLDKEGNLICPKCEKSLEKPDVDYRRAGIWCKCNDCGKSFDIPVTTHFCRECQSTFNFENAVCKDVYTYFLTEEARKEAKLGEMLITPIKEALIKMGFEVESPAFLRGRSGAVHVFNIGMHRKGVSDELIVIDVATVSEGEVSEQPVIAMFAKIYDVMPEKAYLIAIPRISENGKKMASMYKIDIIEAKEQKEAVKILKRKLASEKES